MSTFVSYVPTYSRSREIGDCTKFVNGSIEITWALLVSPEEESIVHGDFKIRCSSRLPVGPEVRVKDDIAAFRHPLQEGVEGRDGRVEHSQRGVGPVGQQQANRSGTGCVVKRSSTWRNKNMSSF